MNPHFTKIRVKDLAALLKLLEESFTAFEEIHSGLESGPERDIAAQMIGNLRGFAPHVASKWDEQDDEQLFTEREEP